MNLERVATIITIVIVTIRTLAAAPNNKANKAKGKGPLADISGGVVVDPVSVGPGTASDGGGDIAVDSVLTGSTANFDPTDLSNLLGHCSAVETDPVNSVFNRMFMSETELDNFVLTAQEELKQPEKRKLKKKNHVQSNKVSKTLGTIGTLSPTGTSEDECCKTNLLVIAPGNVTIDEKVMYAAHMNHSYQYFQIGECEGNNPASHVSTNIDSAAAIVPFHFPDYTNYQPISGQEKSSREENAKCRTIGVCIQVYKSVFMLLYDPKLLNVVQPPVTFVKVDMKSHCECMNVGRATV